ncbi:DUF2207 family protein [Mesobacillus subterraneus]|uniref:DUF2207 family protein n=1 Tax=Mesobacillus subterraneus TaxID=285983 RepID=UPI003531A60C
MEEQLAEKKAFKEKQLNMLENVLLGIAGFLALGVLTLLFTRLLRKLRSADRPEELLRTDPLILYMINRRGKMDSYAFLVGLYSLVEKGKATVRTEQNAGRFLKDDQSSDQTLYFTLTALETSLSKCEHVLVSWLFKRKAKNGNPVFLMSDIAGASSQQRNNPQHLNNYHTKYKLFKDNEKEWFACVLNEVKEEGMMSDKMSKLVGRGLMLILVSAMVYAYYLDSLSTAAIVIYSITAGFLLIRSWLKPGRKLFFMLFYLVSLIASVMLYDAEALTLLLITTVFSAMVTLLMPHMTLSGEAVAIEHDIQAFKKQLKLERFPDQISSQSDKWMIRSLLFKQKRQSRSLEKEFDGDEKSAAPLTYLIATGQNPVEFLVNTWKWSIPPGSSSSSSVSGDSGYSGGGDSGGGSDGGGASAD